jgi:hypothetical protein
LFHKITFEKQSYQQQVLESRCTWPIGYVKGTLWELLKHMVANSPDNIEKWMSVRWLLSEIAKFAQEDYGKKISG